MMVEGLLLGLAYVLPPGPVTAETVRHSLHSGVRGALAVQLGAVGGDLIYALLALAGLSRLLNQTMVRTGAGLLGAALLFALGLSALRGWRVTAEQMAPEGQCDAPSSLWRPAGAGAFVSLMNPFAAGFWVTVGSTAISTTPSWLAGFMLGSLVASLFIGLVAGQLRGQRAHRYARWLSAACGCLLIAFGLKLSWTMLGAL